MPDDPESLAKLIQGAESVAIEVQGEPGAPGLWALALPGEKPVPASEDLLSSGPVTAALGQSAVVAYDGGRLLRGLLRLRCRPSRIFCILTASRLLQDGLPLEHNLDALTARHLPQHLHGILPRDDWGELFSDPSGVLLERCTPLHDLARALRRALASAGLSSVFQLEMRSMKTLAGTAGTAWSLDQDALASEASRASGESREAGEVLAGLLGSPGLHPENPLHLQRALAHAGIRLAGLSTAELLKGNEGRIVPALLAYRAMESRARGLRALLDLAAADGRLSTPGLPPSAASLAVASGGPPPADPSLFLAVEPGRLHLSAGYPHLRVALVACLSAEPVLLDALHQGMDPHTTVAAALFAKPSDELTTAEILSGASANETLLFGQSAALFAVHAAEHHGIVLTDPLTLRRRFFSALPAVARWHEGCQRLARTRPEEVRSVLGRRLLLPEGANSWQRFTALVNAPIAGGCMDLLQTALVAAASSLPRSTRILQATGNRILISCPEEDEGAADEAACAALVSAAKKLFPEMPACVRVSRCGSAVQPVPAELPA